MVMIIINRRGRKGKKRTMRKGGTEKREKGRMKGGK